MGILISHQPDLPVNSSVSYLSQDVDDALMKRVLKLLLDYIQATQKRSLQHLKKRPLFTSRQTSWNWIIILSTIWNYSGTFEPARKLELCCGCLIKPNRNGRPKLKQWIERPLVNRNMINKRHDAVGVLLDHYFERNQLQDELIKVYDLERLAGRIAFGSVNGRDLIQLNVFETGSKNQVYFGTDCR